MSAPKPPHQTLHDATLDFLADTYGAWIDSEKLPACSAEELIHYELLEAEQRAWLREFIVLWELIEVERDA